MRRLGNVLHLSPSRNLILKAEIMPRVGERVVDENLKPVGMVFDVFGPVSSPYVSVKPETMESQRFVGNMLYTVPSAARRKEKRKYGR